MKTKTVKITEGPTKTNIKKDTGGPAPIHPPTLGRKRMYL